MGLRLGFCKWFVDVAVDKVMHYFNWSSYPKVSFSYFFQIGRNAGDAIALLNRVTGNGQVRSIHADECNVCAVQSGYKGQMLASLSASIWRKASSALTEWGMA